MHSLLPPKSESLDEGCEVLFPDTAFYDPENPKPGMAKVIIKTDPITGFICEITDERRLKK